jgi:outer membrane protein with beta-barrel domain
MRLLFFIILLMPISIFGQKHNLKIEPELGLTFQKTYFTKTKTIKPSFGAFIEYIYKNNYSLLTGAIYDPFYAYNRLIVVKIDNKEIETNEIETNIINFPLMAGGHINLLKKLNASIHFGGFYGVSNWNSFENSKYISSKKYTQSSYGICGLMSLGFKINKHLILSSKFRIHKFLDKGISIQELPEILYYDEQKSLNVSTNGYIIKERNAKPITYSFSIGLSINILKSN